MKIILSVINDLTTDQRVHRVASTLYNSGNKVLLVGRRMRGSLYVSRRPYQTKRMRLVFEKSILFYAEYNFRLLLFFLFHKFDLLISNDLDTLPANFIASRLKRKKLAYDSHELFTEVPELEGRTNVKKVWKFIEKLFLPHIKTTYTVNNSIAQHYNMMYGINMRVVRNLPYFQPEYPVIKEKIPSGDKKIVLYQGSVNTGRGIEQVIRAMEYLNNVVFVIAGDGDVLDDMKKLVLQEGLHDKVIFTGRIPFENLLQYTVQADVGIVLEENIGLNYFYSLSNKLFDYVQAKVPVIVSPFPELMKIVESYGIGMVANDHEPVHIAGTLSFMLENAEMRRLWKVNLELAARELCWENEEKVLLEILDHLLKT
ncbi:MAG: glycosyltransferase [Bacteroidia bacterium]|nr:glycosyltransferase [Bacteroidia bacterium]